jgi:hypothetical protein
MKKLLLNLTALLLSVVASFAQQQEFIYQQWAASTGTQQFFYKNITKSDASYNYTAGATINSSGNYDLLLAKYSKAGVLQWIKQYNGAGNGHDMATGLWLDGSGNVYVTGTTYVSSTNANDIITIKYNSSGTQQWLSTYNGSASSYDAGGAIIVNTAGTTVFICGGASTTSNLGDFITISYNASTGAQNWASTYNYNGNYDVAAKISLTGLNQVTLVVSGGVQYNSTTWKYATVNYASSTGNMFGQPQVSGNNTGSIDDLGDICEDATQTYTYVAGSINNTATGTGYDYKLAKLLNSNLSVVWERTWNGADSLNDKASDIIVDASGNVYVTGYTTTDTQDKNYATVKYNSSGTLQWTKYHNGAGNGRDEATSINVDDANNVYVTGTSNTGGSQDYYTIKYKPDNTVVWEKSYNGLFNGLDKAYDVVVDNITKEVLVSGQTQTATGYSYTLVSCGQATTVTNPNEVLYPMFSFTENLGQLLKTNGTSASNVKYYNFSDSPSTYFSDTAVSYVLTSIDTLPATNDTLVRVDRTYSGYKAAGQYGINKRSDYFNFYLAHIPDGRAHVTNYKRLITPELYSKIDLLYTGNSKGLVTTFVCKPGSSPAANIKMKFTGADSIRIVNNDLIIYTKRGQIKHPRAKAYELDNNGTAYILGWFPTYVRSGNEITFTLGTYNTSRNLIIDMGMGTGSGTSAIENLKHSTYAGGSGYDELTDVFTDASGKVYITGHSSSTNFPIGTGLYTALNGLNSSDAIAIKLNNDLTPLWGTYYGGSSTEILGDRAYSIGVDNSGNVFFAGYTTSTDFPTEFPTGSYSDNANTANVGGVPIDIFIVKLSPGGDQKLWATYYGAESAEDKAFDLTLDASGNLYVIGSKGTNTELLPQLGASNYTSGHGLILKFSNAGARLWANAFGGTSCEIRSIDIHGSGNLYLTGHTNTGLQVVNPGGAYYVSTLAGASDAFVSKFNSSNTNVWTTYFGGNDIDVGYGIVTDYFENIFLTGKTKSSSSFPVLDPTGISNYYIGTYQGHGTSATSYVGDAFIAKFYPTGAPAICTYYGANADENALNIAVDNDNRIYVTGTTTSSAFPLLGTNPTGVYSDLVLANTNDVFTGDAFLLVLNTNFDRIWTTYYGGGFGSQGLDIGSALATYQSSKLYMVGATSSSPDLNFPLVDISNGSGAYYYDTYSNGLADGFLAQFDISSIPLAIPSNEEELKSDLLIYPNPTNGNVIIQVHNPENKYVQVLVFDVSGRKIYDKTQKADNTFKLDLSNFTKGMYLINVKIGDDIEFNKKVILN